MAANLDSRRCWVEIDLAALERNLIKVRAALPLGVKYVAVVKADAYGHGFQHTVARLMDAGADIFAVANIIEAKRIEEIGDGWPILILSPLLPEEYPEITERDWLITLSSMEEVDRLEEFFETRGRPFKVHLKIDTGMGRAGVWHTQANMLLAYAREKAHIEVAGVYTHFSSADSDPRYTEVQRARFEHFLSINRLSPSETFLIHADNSAALASFREDSPYNAVRVGLLQFGIQPYRESVLGAVPVETVCSFYTRIALIKELPSGTPLSYGQSYQLEHDSRIAILSAGYADGIPFPSSGSGEVILRGKRCRILGRVTMDQTIIDVSHVAEAQTGDCVVLVGSQGNDEISLTEFSRHGHTIPWETLTSITKRVQRVYKTARNV